MCNAYEFFLLAKKRKKRISTFFVTHRQRHIEFIVRAQSIEAKSKKKSFYEEKTMKERRKAIGSRRRPRRKEILKIREEENVVEEDTVEKKQGPEEERPHVEYLRREKSLTARIIHVFTSSCRVAVFCCRGEKISKLEKAKNVHTN
jgi:hypothetical protein